MCGICGVIYEDRARLPDSHLLAAMNEQLQRRGPDAEGVYRAPGVGLGHRRLAVIDRVGGGQPMTDRSGQVTVCYNGEIYNFLELRRELQGFGVEFQTSSDTEVLLQGFLHWGNSVPERLVGMFAFAIWDARSETLLLARDRLGVKPLYWTSLPDGSLVFGSELSAILANPSVPRCLNKEQVTRYVALGYVLGDDSILQGIHRLTPATILSWKRGRGVTTCCYWDLAAVWSTRPRNHGRPDEVEEQFGDLMQTAVRQRLVSDVPVGAFLSGGLDSSTIVALMRRALGKLETFSIGFEEPSYSELPWARAVARSLGCVHHEEVVRGSDPDLLLEIAARQDEPFADTSIIPSYLLCKVARRHVAVALSGDGGDELLAGYVTHRATAMHRRLKTWPRVLVRAARWAVHLLPDSRRKVNAVFKAKQFLDGTDLETPEAHAWWRMLAGPELLARLLTLDFTTAHCRVDEPFRVVRQQVPTLNLLNQSLYVDYRTWLIDDILVKADRASMAHGLEVRSPYLDHRLVEFCASVPSKLKLRHGQGKVLLRKFARDLVPSAVRRRRKQGFNSPVSHWIAGPWRDLAQHAFSADVLSEHGVFNPETVGRLYQNHLAKQRDHGQLLFTVLMLSLWLNKVKPSIN